ncbi:Rieske 2Fe-2S domain-containing protein [Jannaschia sp. CCS1]|uniref:Rieske 2Fe-2S domain-containing protein n=1 Tax=Jannaschia sp. (strain CCS1) TaxID=290400 RepID=UPI000053AA76|nr:Rieske 2Fe-2S domain-containing protein [Jannaschia sp. CCS1]ABD56040.1 Rieske (2Fe-2S) protein [Jannaschia sp. CCS1]
MSVKYVPVQWNPNKWVYDAVLVIIIVLYITAFLRFGAAEADVSRPIDGAILRMRAFGTAAFFMLSATLCIGPLARMDTRFLPLLYNRRHFGVLTAAVAWTHATYVYGWYFSFTPMDRMEALLTSNTAFDQILGFPIEALGMFALFILLILAATSHDFWLSFLGAPLWKRLHLLIYLAYAIIVAHVALGYLQDTKNPTFAMLFMVAAVGVAGLHVAAWRIDRLRSVSADWVPVCAPAEIAEDRARIVQLGPKERAAIFRYEGNKFSAISNACAHQNGPLGEGRILDGCVTCPWHGFQYRMNDGCAPAPFTEKIPTYQLRLEGGQVSLNRNANPPGTPVEPLVIAELEAGS